MLSLYVVIGASPSAAPVTAACNGKNAIAPGGLAAQPSKAMVSQLQQQAVPVAAACEQHVELSVSEQLFKQRVEQQFEQQVEISES